MLCVGLTIKVKVGIPESFKVGWYPHKITESSDLKTAYKAYRCLVVVLKATEGRKAHKRKNCVSTYPALSGIQLRTGRVLCSYSADKI